jgi:hypothetical protein
VELPFRPQPEPCELLTSWLNRVARAHGFIDAIELLDEILPRDEFAVFIAAEANINACAPYPTLVRLTEATGIPIHRLQRMTLAYWVPPIAEQSDGEGERFSEYIRGFQVLTRKREMSRPPENIPPCPWMGPTSWGDPLECRLCRELAGKNLGYLNWSFGLTASCPWHEVPLTYRVRARPPGTKCKLTVDWFTTMALRRNAVPLPSGVIVSGRWWFRFLRALIEDLYYPELYLAEGDYHRIWLLSGEEMPRFSPRTGLCHYFEREIPEERMRYLRAASAAIDLLMQGEISPPPQSQATLMCAGNESTDGVFRIAQTLV